MRKTYFDGIVSDALMRILESEKTKKRGGKTKKSTSPKKIADKANTEENLKKVSHLVFRLIATRNKLVKNHLLMNWLSDTIKKRTEYDETMEESEKKEQIYMSISQYEFECKQMLDILAPDDKIKEKYMEQVSKA